MHYGIFVLPFMTSCYFDVLDVKGKHPSFTQLSLLDVPSNAEVTVSCMAEGENHGDAPTRNRYYFSIGFKESGDLNAWVLKNGFYEVDISEGVVAQIQHPEPADLTLRQDCGWYLPTEPKPNPVVFKKESAGKLSRLVAFRYGNQLWGFASVVKSSR